MGPDDLFTAAGEDLARSSAPLAVRMRPVTLDEVVGQDHLLVPGSPLRRLVAGDGGPAGTSSLILWGPPGTGKTTLAMLVSSAAGRRFVELSAVTAGVKDVRAVIDEARRQLGSSGRLTVLFVDEVHRFSKAQQDALLPAVENRWVTLVAATTENPFFSVISPLLSRSLLLTLEPLTDDSIRTVVERALEDERGLGGAVRLDDAARDHLLRIAGGDARRALTALEAGEDPRFIARRLIISASEDIGMADPTALPLAVAAAQAVQLIGFPEAQLTLAQATIHLALAPKSNAVTLAVGQALADVRRGLAGAVPAHLRDAHYSGARKLEHGSGYRYAHDYPHGVVAQQYAPDAVHGRDYYAPTEHGAERGAGERVARLRQILRADD